VEKIWISLYTPQRGEASVERLSQADREQIVADLLALRLRHSKLAMPKALIEAYLAPPETPADCVFARTTMSISADLTTKIAPCQFGGDPDCDNCGCIASAGLTAVARHRVGGVIPIGVLFNGSIKIGEQMRRVRPTLSEA